MTADGGLRRAYHYLTEEQVTWLAEYAAARGITRSEALRQLLDIVRANLGRMTVGEDNETRP